MLESLRDLPIVGDIRGAGYFHAIELVKDKDTKETFDAEESEELLRGFLSGELYRRGLICRTDDRGDPIDAALPAADRRTGAVRGDRGDPAARADRGVGADGAVELTVESLIGELGLSLVSGRARPRRHTCAGCTAPSCPTRRLVERRRAAAHDRPRARGTEAPARADRAARRPRHRRARVRHRLLPPAPAGGARDGGAQARLPAVRGPLRAALHRDHRAGVRAAARRTLRNAAAQHGRRRARGGAHRAPLPRGPSGAAATLRRSRERVAVLAFRPPDPSAAAATRRTDPRARAGSQPGGDPRRACVCVVLDPDGARGTAPLSPVELARTMRARAERALRRGARPPPAGCAPTHACA